MPVDEADRLGRFVRIGVAPTLEGVKASTLLCFSRANGLAEAWQIHGPRLAAHLGLVHRVLRHSEATSQVLFHRPGWVRTVLDDPTRCRILRDRGYRADQPGLFDEFCQRCQSGVPDEVGCFLDYPVADVEGFLANQGRGGLLAGWWRVYADPQGALRRFTQITEARRAAEDRWGSFAHLSLGTKRAARRRLSPN